MFIDKVKIFAKAGDGGNGAVSFRREKFVEYGGPDGGAGGIGGDVILVADNNLTDLSDLYYSPRIVVKAANHGQGKGCTGRSSKTVKIRVPIGTQVYRASKVVRKLKKTNYHPAAATEIFEADATVGIPFTPGRALELLRKRDAQPLPVKGESAQDEEPLNPDESTRELMADLTEQGQEFILAHGGRGGRGNMYFKSSSYQVPRDFEFGEPGEELWAELELKTIADIGLVGYPNAGKSTLISKITHAHPKIAAYPFTTLTPNVGILIYPDFKRVRVADIPGLIEGAHTGRGLGHDFLRHIERCRLLIIIVDMAGVDGRKPHDDYRQLMQELKLYNPEILNKPMLIVANKMDMPEAKKNLAAFKRHVRQASSSPKSKTKRPAGKMPTLRQVIEISALEATGMEKLRLALRKALK